MKITDDALKLAVSSSFTIREVLRTLGLKEAGGTHSHYSRRIKELGLDVSHFTGKSSSKGKPSGKKKSASEFLVLRESGSRMQSIYLVRSLLEIGRQYCCEKCGNTGEWMGHKLTLDVDHINENWLDDREENLRFLCPNCHSQFSRKLLDAC